MGHIITFFLIVVAAASIGVARVSRRESSIDRNTKEWIEFLKEDLSGSAL